MTRITSFGIKRTYVEAGFDSTTPTSGAVAPEPTLKGAVPQQGTTSPGDGPPPKKKRKRGKKPKKVASDGVDSVGAGDGNEGSGDKDVVDPSSSTRKTSTEAQEKTTLRKERKAQRKEKFANLKGKVKDKETRARLDPSEIRRQRRMAERAATTTCFACREKGHAARDCPTTKTSPSDLLDEDVSSRQGKVTGKSTVGICYRCGSTKHTLSRCKKPPSPTDPLPFASCFVCSGKGHLASSCPQNKAKGIYPNGGCCKLCGDTSHLAKDCGLRKQGGQDNSVMLGTGRAAGADEDDFHVLKRMTREVEKDEKREEKVKMLMTPKVGSHSNTVVKSGNAVPQKRVVFF